MDNLAYYEHELKLAILLKSRGHEVYFPWWDEGVIFEDQSTLQDKRKTFLTDVEHIKWCDKMIAYIDGNDPGTAVETGIAYALGKPVALYATEFSKLHKGIDISKLYPEAVLPANSNQFWVVQNEPMINNMLLGVSNNTVLNTFEEVIDWIESS